jgi:hypothetical protein
MCARWPFAFHFTTSFRRSVLVGWVLRLVTEEHRGEDAEWNGGSDRKTRPNMSPTPARLTLAAHHSVAPVLTTDTAEVMTTSIRSQND